MENCPRCDFSNGNMYFWWHIWIKCIKGSPTPPPNGVTSMDVANHSLCFHDFASSAYFYVLNFEAILENKPKDVIFLGNVCKPSELLLYWKKKSFETEFV